MKKAVMLLVLGSVGVVALAASPLKVTLSRTLVVSQFKDGKTVENLKTDFSGVKHGDVLLEQVAVENVGEKALGNVRVALPLPVNTLEGKLLGRAAYLSGSATKAGNRWILEFSFDGGKVFALEPLTKKIKVQEGGKTVEKEVVVQPSEYTHARWTLSSIAPKGKLVFGLRAKVN